MITGILDPRLPNPSLVPNPEKNVGPWSEELLKKEKSVSISPEEVEHRIGGQEGIGGILYRFSFNV